MLEVRGPLEGRDAHRARKLFTAAILSFIFTSMALPVSSLAAETPPPHPRERFSQASSAMERVRQVCESRGLQMVPGVAGQCTHGEDPAPPGMHVKQEVAPLPALPASESGAAASTGMQDAAGSPMFACDGNGTEGQRIQVLYARPSDRADRYDLYRESILQWAWEADQIFRNSAQETGGMRRIRFVHDAQCTPTVPNVTLTAAGDDNLTNTINQLSSLGYNRSDRKYLIFMDATVLCGVGTLMADDRPGQDNWNNMGPDYGRVDAGCWSGHIAAHELMHNLGGVQHSAPNASGGYHCTDQYDVMCYSDSPNYPAMKTLCPTQSRKWSLFDCNYDDYFNTQPPPGSYLATHWNTADNRFLASNSGTQAACPDQAWEPDDTWSTAKAIAVGTTVTRALCTTGDQDWMSFPAVGNRAYQVQILSADAAITPTLEVYAANGTFQLASHAPPPGGLATLQMVARTGGRHYVRVRNLNPDHPPGTGNVYQIRVTSPAAPTAPVGGFGFNGFGQLGLPLLDSVISNPTGSLSLPTVQVAGGYLHSAAVLSNGTVRTWGWNPLGQLGNGTVTDSATAVQPSGLSGVTSVSAGLAHTLALKSDGTVWAWGWNALGQLGDGTTTDRLTPVRVTGLTNIVEIDTGFLHSVARRADGTVWTWGWNGLSSLGDGSTVYMRSTPVKASLSNVVGVSAGGYHNLAVLENGTVRAWGYNEQGQLGIGNRVNRATPVTIPGLSGVYQVSAGWVHSVALRNDGTVWAWGYNEHRQAGGSGPDRLVPAAITCSSDPSCPKAGGSNLAQVVWVSAGGLHNSVLTGNGAMYGWGWNAAGALGNGGLVDSATAVRAGSLTVRESAAGFFHTLYRP